MERLRDGPSDGDRVRLDEIGGSIAIETGPGHQEWRGRFWLPDHAMVRPGDKSCLTRGDARSWEWIVEGPGPSATAGHVAVFEDDRHFE